MPNWFPYYPILLLMIIPINLVTVPKSLLIKQDLTVTGAVQTEDIKISPRHSEPATRVNGGCKNLLANTKN